MTTNNENNKYWVGFNLIPGIGRVKFTQIENYFGDIRKAWNAGIDEFKKAGLDDNATNSIAQWRPKISLDSEIEKLEKHNIKAFNYHDKDYPARLKEIHDFPPVIYVRGNILAEDEYCLAVVGTRNPSVYGRQLTEEIVSELAKNRITVISGLAKGIDTIAHQSALNAGGRTIAVMGGGLDSVYPAENANLARNILKNGAMISEYAPGTKPRPENFPRRNRIMSGLCLGVLVIEAGETSGSLITAHLAFEQDREVFAIPGSVLSPASIGTNKLIMEGTARLVCNAADILQELNLTAVAEQIEVKEIIPASDTEAVILRQLGAEPRHIDEICRASGLPISVVSSTLAMMELKGMVKQVGSMSYALCREIRENKELYKIEIN
ncbi:MAG: DNA-processing protein DprA [Dehalococcoidales bacterium]|nr:DNA-processing protein DprA [Dehalococcoidales bacterium]